MSVLVRPAAASSLLAGLLGASPPPVTTGLVEVARTRVSVHYETGRDDVPVLCVCTPQAVVLPASLLTPVLPTTSASVVDGLLVSGGAAWPVTRWWRPTRPAGLTAPLLVPTLPGVDVPRTLRPERLVGRGPGLTPSGDDLLAGALVAAHATTDPRLERWAAETRELVAAGHTTPVSRALLWQAADGWAVPELADFLTAVCADSTRSAGASAALLRVGHTSGGALAAGALHVLTTAPNRSREAA